MCGGSWNHVVPPPERWNGDRNRPAASSAPSPAAAARWRTLRAGRGAVIATPWEVPPLTTTMCPSLGRPALVVAGPLALIRVVHGQDSTAGAQRAPVAQPQAGADPDRQRKTGQRSAHVSALPVVEVADPEGPGVIDARQVRQKSRPQQPPGGHLVDAGGPDHHRLGELVAEASIAIDPTRGRSGAAIGRCSARPSSRMEPMTSGRARSGEGPRELVLYHAEAPDRGEALEH